MVLLYAPVEASRVSPRAQLPADLPHPPLRPGRKREPPSRQECWWSRPHPKKTWRLGGLAAWGPSPSSPVFRAAVFEGSRLGWGLHDLLEGVGVESNQLFVGVCRLPSPHRIEHPDRDVGRRPHDRRGLGGELRLLEDPSDAFGANELHHFLVIARGGH